MARHLTEALVLRFIPERQLPAIVSHAGIVAIVAGVAAIRYALADALIGYPILLFVPAVFLCALLLNRGAGYLATIASALVGWGFFLEPGRSIPWAPVLIFHLVGFSLSAIIEALRRTVRRLDEAERAKSLLLAELTHRTKNDLAIISAAITLQSDASADPAVKEALGQANARVMIVSSAQDRLRSDFGDGIGLDLAAYVERLCAGLGDLLRGVRPIAVRVECASAIVPGSTAITVGLIVNELVTNCFKYAFPDETAGTVRVRIAVESPRIIIHVEDDGMGCPSDSRSGMGSRLVRLLAQQKGGTFTREDMNPGCRVRVDLHETGAL